MFGGFSEMSDIKDIQGSKDNKISHESLEKYDKIMGDVGLSETQYHSETNVNEKFDNLFSDEKSDSSESFWDDIFSCRLDDCPKTQMDGLSNDEKNIIKSEVGWASEIVDSMRSFEEYKIYRDAGLIEGAVNGKECLMKTDIDWERKDQFGSTNKERVAEGYAPLDKNGRPIQLHHIGQHADSPLAELTFEEHRTGGNDTILHDKNKETEVHGEGNNWDHERKDYWKNRLE